MIDLYNWPPHRVLGEVDDISNCQQCHGSQIIAEKLDSGYDTKFVSLSVNCESCHGPAKNHETIILADSWTEVIINIPDAAKVTSGVLIKVRQLSASNADAWAITSVICEVGASDEASLVEVVDIPGYTDPTDHYVGFTSVTSGIVSFINTSSPKLVFRPDTGNLTATSYTSLSDIKAKININNINDPIGITQQLNGVTFNWKDSKKPSIGLIAQDVEKILPEIIETDSNGYKTVNYDAIIPILVESVKNHEIRIEKLEENS